MLAKLAVRTTLQILILVDLVVVLRMELSELLVRVLLAKVTLEQINLAIDAATAWRARAEKAESDLAALRHDIERAVQTSSELATENERLREWIICVCAGVQSLEVRSGRRRSRGWNREDVLYRQGADVLRV